MKKQEFAATSVRWLLPSAALSREIAPEGVNILSTGVVLGTVITRKLVIEDSVLFSGSCFAVNDQDLFDAALSEYNNRKALSRSLASAARSQI